MNKYQIALAVVLLPLLIPQNILAILQQVIRHVSKGYLSGSASSSLDFGHCWMMLRLHVAARDFGQRQLDASHGCNRGYNREVAN